VSEIIRIGVDTSKYIFQLHGVDAAEQPVLRKRLGRKQMLEFFAKLPPTQIGMEACGAAHYWARELGRLGHDVKLMAPQHVKPYVRRNKNDGRDAEGLCEAMSRPTMRFVPVKTAEQQAALMLVGLREQMVARRTQLSNMIRGYAAEFGITAAKGLDKIEALLAEIAQDERVPAPARDLFALQDHPRRRREAAQRTGGGSNRRDQASHARPRSSVTLAGGPAQAQAAETGGRGARQQECPHRLEADGDGRELRRCTDASCIRGCRLTDRPIGFVRAAGAGAARGSRW
jgi:transposase